MEIEKKKGKEEERKILSFNSQLSRILSQIHR